MGSEWYGSRLNAEREAKVVASGGGPDRTMAVVTFAALIVPQTV